MQHKIYLIIRCGATRNCTVRKRRRSSATTDGTTSPSPDEISQQLCHHTNFQHLVRPTQLCQHWHDRRTVLARPEHPLQFTTHENYNYTLNIGV